MVGPRAPGRTRCRLARPDPLLGDLVGHDQWREVSAGQRRHDCQQPPRRFRLARAAPGCDGWRPVCRQAAVPRRVDRAAPARRSHDRRQHRHHGAARASLPALAARSRRSGAPDSGVGGQDRSRRAPDRRRRPAHAGRRTVLDRAVRRSRAGSLPEPRGANSRRCTKSGRTCSCLCTAASAMHRMPHACAS